MQNKEERRYSVYKHIFPNGKIYIGITSTTTQRRWRGGLGYAKGSFVYNAIKKYGWNNVRHEILYNNLTEDIAKKNEIELIALYKTCNRIYGYNQTLGGEGSYGRELTSEMKKEIGKRLSDANRGKTLTSAHRQKISCALKGRDRLSQKGREKIIESNKNRDITEKTRKKISINTSAGMLNSEKWLQRKELMMQQKSPTEEIPKVLNKGEWQACCFKVKAGYKNKYKYIITTSKQSDNSCVKTQEFNNWALAKDYLLKNNYI